MDKNINTFVMRLKEWFSWHFPELARIITDNNIFDTTLKHITVPDNCQTPAQLFDQFRLLSMVSGRKE